MSSWRHYVYKSLSFPFVTSRLFLLTGQHDVGPGMGMGSGTVGASSDEHVELKISLNNSTGESGGQIMLVALMLPEREVRCDERLGELNSLLLVSAKKIIKLLTSFQFAVCWEKLMCH